MTNFNNKLSSNNVKDPIEILEFLHSGNKRFMENTRMNRDHHTSINATKNAQRPYAAILSCMDSRVSAELVFDQGIGDIFNIRIAGNIVTPEVLGSLEYAVEVTGTSVILILGHTSCGAIGGACDQIRMGNLTGLLQKIAPAVNSEQTIKENRNSQNKDFVHKVTLLHLNNVSRDMLDQSPLIARAVEDSRLLIATGIYDVATGAVQFIDKVTNEGILKIEQPLTDKETLV